MLTGLTKIMYIVIGFILLTFVYGLMGNSINNGIETIINGINQNLLILFNNIESILLALLVFGFFFAFIKKNFLRKKG